MRNPEHFCAAPGDALKVWPTNRARPAFNEVMTSIPPVEYTALAQPKAKMPVAHAYFSRAITAWIGEVDTLRRGGAVAHDRGNAAPLRTPQRPALVERILADLKTPALRQPPPVERALGHAVLALIGVITAMQVGVEQLEAALGVEFDAHPLAPVLRSAPGPGPVLAARVLAEVGDDAARFTSATGLCGAQIYVDHGAEVGALSILSGCRPPH